MRLKRIGGQFNGLIKKTVNTQKTSKIIFLYAQNATGRMTIKKYKNYEKKERLNESEVLMKNNLSYELCASLKEIGLKQKSKKVYTYCPKCNEVKQTGHCIKHVVVGGEQITETVSIPTTDQLLEWLEGKEKEILIARIHHPDVNWRVSVVNSKGNPIAIVDKHLPTALAKLIIELEGE